MADEDWRSIVNRTHQAPIVHHRDEDGHEWWTWCCSCGTAQGFAVTGAPNDDRNQHIALMTHLKRMV